MPCEIYREALIEAAASGLTPQGELRAHVEACGSCRALFAEEQALFATIDAGLQGAANAEVPPSLLPRVRAQVNHQTIQRHSWISAWTAIAAAAALVAVTLLVRDWKRGAAGPDSPQSPVAHNILGAGSPTTPAIHPREAAARSVRNERVRPVKIGSGAGVEQVSVLVPAGQKEVLDAFLAGLRRGALRPEGLLAEKPEQPMKDLQVSALDIPPIVVKPLADVSGETAPESETARP